MPDITPTRGYPFPVPADSINVPRDVQALATAIDDDIGTRPYCYVRLSTPHALTTDAWAKVLLDDDVDDPLGMFQPSTSRVIIPAGRGGIYVATGSVNIYPVHADSTAGAMVKRNGIEVGVGATPARRDGGGGTADVAAIFRCSAGDYVELWAYTNIVGAGTPMAHAFQGVYLQVGQVA